MSKIPEIPQNPMFENPEFTLFRAFLGPKTSEFPVFKESIKRHTMQKTLEIMKSGVLTCYVSKRDQKTHFVQIKFFCRFYVFSVFT